MSAVFIKTPADWIEDALRELRRAGDRAPRSLAKAYLRLLQFRAFGGAEWPQSTDIAATLGWGAATVSRLLHDEAAWADPDRADEWKLLRESRGWKLNGIQLESKRKPSGIESEPVTPNVEAARIPAGSAAEAQRNASEDTRGDQKKEEMKKEEPAEGAGARAPRTAGPDLETLRAWAAYRDEQMCPPPDAGPSWIGIRRGDRPPVGWGVAERVAEAGADRVIAVVQWAHRSMHRRAVQLREGGYTGRTLFRPGNFPEYDPLAQQWLANGKTDAPAAVQPRGRDRPATEAERHAAMFGGLSTFDPATMEAT